MASACLYVFQATILTEGDRIGRYSVTEGGTLVIDRAQKEDVGDWVCQARSIAGSAYAKAKLDVKGKFLSKDVAIVMFSGLFIKGVEAARVKGVDSYCPTLQQTDYALHRKNV